jgi:hypothetical protein
MVDAAIPFGTHPATVICHIPGIAPHERRREEVVQVYRSIAPVSAPSSGGADEWPRERAAVDHSIILPRESRPSGAFGVRFRGLANAIPLSLL